MNPADAPVLTLAITSTTLPLTEVHDLVDTRLAQKISQVTGVGLVSIAGGQRPAVRIQANPQALAAHGLTLDTCATRSGRPTSTSRRAASTAPSARSPSTPTTSCSVAGGATGPDRRLSRRRAGAALDVADVVDGAENVAALGLGQRAAGVILNVQRQPGANVIEVVDRIKELLPELTAGLPSSLEVDVLSDRTTEHPRVGARRADRAGVGGGAGGAGDLRLPAQRPRATLIPSLAVPLSLIGTFGAMYLLGLLSLNNLTLMALTIATGFVVDDAIVMIENIARHIEEGEPPMQAALKGAARSASPSSR